MNKHILIEAATRFDLGSNSNNDALKDATYDRISGYWIENDTSTPLMKNPNRPKPTTKKCDIETGEDKK